MSDPADVFGTAPAVTPEVKPQETLAPQAAPVVDLFADQLKGITNISGEPKYGTVPVALDALKTSQEYIPTLEAQLLAEQAKVAALEEEVNTLESVEDMVERLSSQNQEPVAAQTPTNSLDQEAVLKLVNQTLENRKANDVAMKNYESVVNTLTEKYGDKTAEVVAAKAASLGVAPEVFRELAAKSPSLVLGHFEGMTPKDVQTPQGTVHIPPVSTPETVGRPTKSLLLGATSQEQAEFMKKIKDEVYKEYNITT